MLLLKGLCIHKKVCELYRTNFLLNAFIDNTDHHQPGSLQKYFNEEIMTNLNSSGLTYRSTGFKTMDKPVGYSVFPSY